MSLSLHPIHESHEASLDSKGEETDPIRDVRRGMCVPRGVGGTVAADPPVIVCSFFDLRYN